MVSTHKPLNISSENLFQGLLSIRLVPLRIVTALTDAQRAQIELSADEMHFLPVPDSGWSIALLRYRPPGGGGSSSSPRAPAPPYPPYVGTSIDAALWDDTDFDCGDHWRAAKLPVMLVPGCASNAYTFDTAPGYSLVRLCTVLVESS
jgi:hypothetical protein